MADKDNASPHPLFNMEVGDEENLDTGSSEESGDQIDDAVNEMMADADLPGARKEGDETPNIGAPPAEEKPAAAATDSDDLSGYSQEALTALFYQQSRGIIAKDVVIPKDLDADGMLELLTSAKASAETVKEEEKVARLVELAKNKLEAEGISKKDFELLQHLKGGGSGAAVSRYLDLKSWATDVPANEEEKLEVIKFAAELAGQKPEYVDAWIAQNLVEPEEIDKALVEAQKTIDALAEKELEADKDRMQQVEKSKQEQWTSFETNVRTFAEKGFRGIKLSKADQLELVDYMTKKSIPTDVVKNGQKVRELITPYQAFGKKLQKDIEENMAFAYYSMKGSAGMVNAASQTANDKFLAAAAAAAQKNTGGKKSSEQQMDEAEGELLTSISFQ